MVVPVSHLKWMSLEAVSCSPVEDRGQQGRNEGQVGGVGYGNMVSMALRKMVAKPKYENTRREFCQQ